jgi:hypothetical protein
MSALAWWFLHLTGADNGSGPWYLFWSGAGANLGELTIVIGLASLYLRHNCHVKGCWRIGRHPVEGTGYVVCRRHHPEDAPNAVQVRQRYRRVR